MYKKKKKRCSICYDEIAKKYCSNCGQYLKNKRVTSFTILGDLFSNTFSVEKSFFTNIKTGVLHPEKLVLNYWNGYRGFYYSPGRFFTITSLFILLHYIFADRFIGFKVESTISNKFFIPLFNIFILTLFSYITYFKYKKNYYEHLILNVYNISLWTILFVPISVLLFYTINNNEIEKFFYIPFNLLIILWNSRAFEMSKLKRFLYVSLNVILFYGTILLLIINNGSF
jgi:hypothetical protein